MLLLQNPIPIETRSDSIAVADSLDLGSLRLLADGQPFWNRVDAFIDQYFFVVLGLAILFPAILIVEAMKLRARRSNQENRNVGTGLLAAIPRSWYLLVAALTVSGGTIFHLNQQVTDYKRRYEQTRSKLERTVDEYYLAETGKRPEPFQPIRPKHPRRMGGVYYRGNDERHVELYNGGFYQTAEINVMLKTNSGQGLNYGDTVAANLVLEFEIEAAPKTAPGLFDESIMSKVFLSDQRNDQATESQPVVARLATIEANRKWRTRFPVELNVEDVGSLERFSQSGLIFVYLGDPDTNPFRAIPHYGIRFQLDLEKGKIQPTSEVWMGPIYVPENALIASERQISLSEWLDYRPMPEIKRDNTKDPKLLGEDQYDGLKNEKSK